MALSDHGQYSGVVDIARNGIDEVIRLQAQAKQDEALIRQMLEAIEAETYDIWDCYRYHPKLHDAAVAARARLGEKT